MKTTNFNDFLQKTCNAEERAQIDMLADNMLYDYQTLRAAISEPVKKHMTEHHLKFDDLKEKLGTGTSQTQRIINGQGNFTLETILKVAHLLGKRPRIIFD